MKFLKSSPVTAGFAGTFDFIYVPLCFKEKAGGLLPGTAVEGLGFRVMGVLPPSNMGTI